MNTGVNYGDLLDPIPAPDSHDAPLRVGIWRIIELK